MKKSWIPGLLCACLGQVLGGCSTPSSLVSHRTDIFTDFEPVAATRIAVFANWTGACDSCSDGEREAMQDRIADCISSGVRSVSDGIEVLNGGTPLGLDTGALIKDPRRYGVPDPRLGDILVGGLVQKRVALALVFDVETNAKALSVDRGVLAGGESGVLVGNKANRLVHTRLKALLIDVAQRRWLASVEQLYAGKETSGFGVLLPFFVPIPFANSNTTRPEACASIGRSVARLLHAGSRGTQDMHFDATDEIQRSSSRAGPGDVSGTLPDCIFGAAPGWQCRNMDTKLWPWK